MACELSRGFSRCGCASAIRPDSRAGLRVQLCRATTPDRSGIGPPIAKHPERAFPFVESIVVTDKNRGGEKVGGQSCGKWASDRAIAAQKAPKPMIPEQRSA